MMDKVSDMKWFSYLGWFALLLYLTGCGFAKDNDNTPYKHTMCVVADSNTNVHEELLVQFE